MKRDRRLSHGCTHGWGYAAGATAANQTRSCRRGSCRSSDSSQSARHSRGTKEAGRQAGAVRTCTSGSRLGPARRRCRASSAESSMSAACGSSVRVSGCRTASSRSACAAPCAAPAQRWPRGRGTPRWSPSPGRARHADPRARRPQSQSIQPRTRRRTRARHHRACAACLWYLQATPACRAPVLRARGAGGVRRTRRAAPCFGLAPSFRQTAQRSTAASRSQSAARRAPERADSASDARAATAG